MLHRCVSRDPKKYRTYAGRGIRVCDRWKSFLNFLADMEETYFPGATIERENGDLGYNPENCRWATTIEQANNKVDNHPVTFRGATRTIAQWSRETGIKRYLIQGRLARGWSPEEALTTFADARRKGHRRREALQKVAQSRARRARPFLPMDQPAAPGAKQ